MERVRELHRKSLVRLMNSPLKRRGRSYGAGVDDAVRVICFDYICAERLTSNLVWMAQQLQAHGEKVSQEIPMRLIRQLGRSASTGGGEKLMTPM